MVKLVIQLVSQEQLENIRMAEEQLSKAGVIFDIGNDVEDTLEGLKPIRRIWELTSSLKGAEIKFEEP